MGGATSSAVLGTEAPGPWQTLYRVTDDPQSPWHPFYNTHTHTHTHTHVHAHTHTHTQCHAVLNQPLIGNSTPPKATHWLLSASSITRICAKTDLSDIWPIGAESLLCCTLSFHLSSTTERPFSAGCSAWPWGYWLKEAQPQPSSSSVLLERQTNPWLWQTLLSRERLGKLPAWLLYFRAVEPL